MNLPNKLSLLRVGLIPICVAFMYLNTSAGNILAALVFAIASFTDYLDGRIARKHDIVTNFGKFIDPVADKLLVLTTMIMLVEQNALPAYVVIIILMRELAVDGLRLVAASKNVIMAAGKLGKIKTSLQMTAILLYLVGKPFSPLPQLFMAAALVMTIVSGFDYFRLNKSVISDKE